MMRPSCGSSSSSALLLRRALGLTAVGLLATLILGCNPSPTSTTAPPTSTVAAWVAAWNPAFVAFQQERTSFVETVDRLSTTYAQTAQAAEDLAGATRSLRDEMAATEPPSSLEAAAQGALDGVDAAIAAADTVAERCLAADADRAAAPDCLAAIAAWRLADEAMTAAMTPFASPAP